jgi:hypothetical protein
MLLSRLAGINDAAAVARLSKRGDRFAWILDGACNRVRHQLVGCGWTAQPGEDPRRTMAHAGERLLSMKGRPRWAAVCSMIHRWFDQRGPAGSGDAHLLVCLALARHDDKGRLFGPDFGGGWLERAAAAWDDHDESFMLDGAGNAVRRLWADSPLYPLAVARESACVLIPLPKETLQ